MSCALEIVRHLRDQGIGRVMVCEPYLEQSTEFDLHRLDDVVARADILLVLVDHAPFKRLRSVELKEKIVIDTRGIL